MLMIRLKRVGRKHDPSYRIVVTEKQRGPKSGRYLENVGFYDPRKDVRTINKERVEHWVSEGAQVSGTVHNILVSENIIDAKKVNVLPKKRPQEKTQMDADDKTQINADKTQMDADEKAPIENVEVEIPAESSPASDTVEETPEAAVEEKKEEPKG